MLIEIKKPTIFLDRDGVLTEENGYITSINNLKIFPYAAECVRRIHEKGYYAIVITNQSGVARGLLTEEKLWEMNDYLVRQTNVDAVYYCPHYPQGKVEKYAILCDCRKPKSGLIKKACKDFQIDLKQSFMVGDRASDILAGKNIGIHTIILESGYGTDKLEKDVEADYTFLNLEEFVSIL